MNFLLGMIFGAIIGWPLAWLAVRQMMKRPSQNPVDAYWNEQAMGFASQELGYTTETGETVCFPLTKEQLAAAKAASYYDTTTGVSYLDLTDDTATTGVSYTGLMDDEAAAYVEEVRRNDKPKQ